MHTCSHIADGVMDKSAWNHTTEKSREVHDAPIGYVLNVWEM